jgi:hypothetical protein
MDAYGILRMTKVSNWGAIAKLGGHHLREEGYEAKSNPDIDSSRTHLNYRLDDSGEGGLVRLVNARIREGHTVTNKGGTTKKMRDDAVKMVDVVCTSSPEFFAGLTADQQKEYFSDCLGWLRGYFGASNVVSAVVHMDETTPHMHVGVVPIHTEKGEGRLNAKRFMGSRKDMRAIQDDYFQKVSKDWGLKRGDPVELTKREHLSVPDFKASTDGLRQEIAQERASLEAASKAEMDGLRRKIAQERASLEQDAEKRRIEVLAKIKVLEDRVKLTDKEILEWIDTVKEETEVESRKPKGAKKPVDMAVLPVERLNEVLQVLESKIYADLENKDKISSLKAAADRKDGIIQDYDKNWIPKDQLKAAGLTPETLTEMAQARQQARQQQKQKELTKEKSSPAPQGRSIV